MDVKYDILVDHIRKKMKSNGLTKMSQLADALEIEASTLSNNIKYISKVDSFDTPFFSKLTDVLKVEKKSFIQEIEKDLNKGKNIEDLFLSKKYADVSDKHKDYYETLVDLISNLKEGDTYTLVTTDIPLEFIGYEKFVDGLVQSLMGGANFQYVFPDTSSSKFIEDFRKYWPEPTEKWWELERLHKNFIDKIYKENAKRHTNFELNKNELENKLKLIKCDDPYLMHPFFKFMWLHKDERKINEKLDIVFVEYRIGNLNSIDIRDQFRLWYPLPEIEGKKIIKQIQKYAQGK